MSSRSVEVINHQKFSERPVLTCEGVQVGTRQSFVRAMRFFYSLITLVYVACLFAPFWPIGVAGVMLFGTGTIYCWRSDWIVAQANANGMTAQYRIRKKFISWSEVASCDIITIHTMHGKFANRYPVLKDANGTPVFSTTFSYAAQADRDRLIEFIKAALS